MKIEIKYEVKPARQGFVIVKQGVKCSDREIKMKNDFWSRAEAEQQCDYLNNGGL